MVVVPAGLYWSKTGTIIRDTRGKIQRSNERETAEQTLITGQNDWKRFAATPSSGFVLSDDDEAAMISTEQRINAVFSELGGSTTSMTSTADDGPREGVRSIMVDVEGSLPRENLGPLLTRLESEPAYIVISEFEAIKESDNRLRVKIVGSAFRLLEAGT